jgi:hypothetical protein
VPSVLPVAGTPEQFAEAKALAKLGAQAEAVLAAESPLSFDRFARALAMAWGIQRVTERVRERVRSVVAATAVELEGVLWRRGDDAQAFRGFRVPAEGADGRAPRTSWPLVEINERDGVAPAPASRDGRRGSRARSGAVLRITRLGAVVRGRDATGRRPARAAGRGVRDGEVVRLPVSADPGRLSLV